MATSLKLGTVPGVYIQEEVNPALAITEQRLKTAGLVGHATPTIKVSNIKVTRGSGSEDILVGYDLASANDLLCVSDYVNAYGTNLPQYTKNTDFTLTYDAPQGVVKITWLTTGSAVSPVTGSIYYVTLVTKKTYDYYTQDVTITRGSSTTDELTGYSVDGIANVYKVYQGTTVYNYGASSAVTDADYGVSVNSTTGVPTITWYEPVPGEDHPVNPAANSKYTVTLVLKKESNYYKPQVWEDYDSVAAYYGPACYQDSNNSWVLNEITAAAKLMFSNGANVVYICEIKPGATSADEFTNLKAAVKSLSDYELQTLICVPQSKAIQDFLKTQVVIDSATENGKERVAWVSAHDVTTASDTATDDPDTIAAQSKYFKEQRIINIAPSKVTLLMEDASGETHEFANASSIYAAAALTGMTVNNERTVAEPLTRKTPSGIYGLSRNYNRAEIEKLSAAGTTVLVTRNSAISVNQAVTTDTTNQNNREVSVVLIKDEVMKKLRYNLDKEYIGHFYDRNKTPTSIKTSIMTLLQNMIGTLVQDFDASNIVVTPDSEDSTRVNVKMAFAVLRPLNYIYISFMVTL